MAICALDAVIDHEKPNTKKDYFLCIILLSNCSTAETGLKGHSILLAWKRELDALTSEVKSNLSQQHY